MHLLSQDGHFREGNRGEGGSAYPRRANEKSLMRTVLKAHISHEIYIIQNNLNCHSPHRVIIVEGSGNFLMLVLSYTRQ